MPDWEGPSRLLQAATVSRVSPAVLDSSEFCGEGHAEIRIELDGTPTASDLNEKRACDVIYGSPPSPAPRPTFSGYSGFG